MQMDDKCIMTNLIPRIKNCATQVYFEKEKETVGTHNSKKKTITTAKNPANNLCTTNADEYSDTWPQCTQTEWDTYGIK